MREEKFSEVYKKYGSLVIRMLLAGCKNEEVAQRLCFQVFQGYYLRMGMLSDSLIRPWIIWFTRKQVKEYRRTHEKDGTPKEPVEVLGKKENPPRSDLRIQASLDQMARNHTDKSVLEDLKEKNEDWYKMVYLAAHFGLDEEELAENMGMDSLQVCVELYEAKQYLVYKYLDELREEYKKQHS